MKLVLLPSLEHMTLVKITISLLNQACVNSLISKLDYFSVRSMESKRIEERVMAKVSQLSLPQPLKEKLFGIIKPIVKQIFDYMRYYCNYDACMGVSYSAINLPVHLPAKLCWTPQGTVDKKRTAEVLIKDENLEVFRRYKIACDYFLEDDIIRLWNRLPEDVKDFDWDYYSVVRFWSNNKMRGRADHASYKHLFYHSLHINNKVAAKYFLQKLTPREREKFSLKELADHVNDADTLCFLLSQLSEEQQMEVFRHQNYRGLLLFLQWPWQSFFIGVANCMWDFLSRRKYDKTLRHIIHKIKDGYKDCDYQKLFREFWQESPSALKDSFINEIDNSLLVQYLFDMKDKGNIRLILKDATLKAKEKLIYSEKINNYLTRFIRDNEWDFLEFFIQECLPSKNEMLKFKEEFEKRKYFKKYLLKSTTLKCSTTKKHKWDKLFHFSDDSTCKYDKRNVEQGESSSSKRFQSLQ